MTPETRELQELVQELHQGGSPWLPAGLGSRLGWGPPVAEPHRVVSCRRLNRILEHNPGDFTLTVEAGTPLVEVQEALAHHGQWLPLDWPWGSGPDGAGSGSIGGLLARGLAGGYRQRYLGVRDQVIGIALLRTDGVQARAGGKVVKNVAGYDLMRLLCGSWGSLALITAATLRTQPIPPQRCGLRLAGELGALAAFCRWLLDSSLTPERLDWQRLGGDPILLVSLASITRPTLTEQIACLQTQANAGGLDLQTVEPAALAPATPTRTDWLLRLGVKPDQTAALLADPGLNGLELVIGAGSGLGYAWTPEPTLAGAPTLPAYRIEALRQQCLARGGYLTVLQQPASTAIPAWLDTPSRPMIEAIKRQFDPKQQLARGRLPGVAPQHRQPPPR